MKPLGVERSDSCMREAVVRGGCGRPLLRAARRKVQVRVFSSYLLWKKEHQLRPPGAVLPDPPSHLPTPIPLSGVRKPRRPPPLAEPGEGEALAGG